MEQADGASRRSSCACKRRERVGEIGRQGGREVGRQGGRVPRRRLSLGPYSTVYKDTAQPA